MTYWKRIEDKQLNYPQLSRKMTSFSAPGDASDQITLSTINFGAINFGDNIFGGTNFGEISIIHRISIEISSLKIFGVTNFRLGTSSPKFIISNVSHYLTRETFVQQQPIIKM